MATDSRMKLTYIQDNRQKNAYLLPTQEYGKMRESVGDYIYGEGSTTERNFRTYWMDKFNDEIEIQNQTDYQFFLKDRSENLHLRADVLATKAKAVNFTTDTTKSASDNGMFPTKPVHSHVECDGCKVNPIVGFRYKCIECGNFDLCQRCEAKHLHAEHMMVRMPHDNCPNVIEAWVTGRSSRRAFKRGSKGHCPFVSPMGMEMPATTTSAPGGGDSEQQQQRHHHSRRSHRRREMNSGLFGHLYKMMQDLAEGGVKNDEESTPESDTATAAASAAAAAASAATAAANVSAATAAAAARQAAEVLAGHQQQQQEATATGAQETPVNKETASKAQSSTGALPKTPPPTPRSNATGAAPETEIPILDSPSLENLAQYIDPQYMRAGIQILNNFSEMFAKMLDPADGASSMSGPFDEMRGEKAATSSTSSGTSTTSSTTTSTAETAEKPVAPKEEQQAENLPTTTTATPPSTPPVVESAEATPQVSRRSHSFDENDWQMIDKQTSMVNESNDTTVETNETEKIDGDVIVASTPKEQSIDFIQLSKDLKAHIEEEQKREEQKTAQVTAAPAPTTPAAVVTPPVASIQQATAPVQQVAAPVQQVAAPGQPVAAAPVPQPRIPEERRAVMIYHQDPRINNAVHAMMAMGFSNEGAWLTQLLESVNGSIPDALDLMNVAQRNNN